MQCLHSNMQSWVYDQVNVSKMIPKTDAWKIVHFLRQPGRAVSLPFKRPLDIALFGMAGLAFYSCSKVFPLVSLLVITKEVSLQFLPLRSTVGSGTIRGLRGAHPYMVENSHPNSAIPSCLRGTGSRTSYKSLSYKLHTFYVYVCMYLWNDAYSLPSTPADSQPRIKSTVFSPRLAEPKDVTSGGPRGVTVCLLDPI